MKQTNKYRYCFIVNPISGGRSKQKLLQKLEQFFNKHKKIDYNILYTSDKQREPELVQKGYSLGYNVFIAVGGDGTVNKVVGALVGLRDVFFSVLPCGSGNGFARAVGLNHPPKKNLQKLLATKTKEIDVVQMGNEFFINVAGIGFDAHIAHLFSELKTRGLRTYTKLILKEFKAYQSIEIEYQYQGKWHKQSCFMFSIANGTQFGNNAFIAPKAKFDDGLFEVCIFKKPTFWQAITLALMVFAKRVDRHVCYQRISVKQLKLKSTSNFMHLDGEPFRCEQQVEFKVLEKALQVIV